MTRKAFWKSKGFWGGLGSILTGLSIIFTTGHVSSDAILAIGTGGLAVYGRVIADTPLSLGDRTEETKADVPNIEVPADADRGN